MPAKIAQLKEHLEVLCVAYLGWFCVRPENPGRCLIGWVDAARSAIALLLCCWCCFCYCCYYCCIDFWKGTKCNALTRTSADRLTNTNTLKTSNNAIAVTCQGATLIVTPKIITTKEIQTKKLQTPLDGGGLIAVKTQTESREQTIS